ncbi:MAG: hypothetical protein AAF614_00385 [Chloroflexota bacterium]
MTDYVEHSSEDSFSPEPQNPNNRRLTLLLFIGILAVAALGYLIYSTQGGSLVGAERPLKPLRDNPTPVPVIVDSQPVIVTFTQLNEDPAALLNRTIRVTGSYTPLELPNCQDNYSGPRIAWSLIAEELQLDAQGFEEVLKIVPPGTTLTIEGTWRFYQGPRGCGKEPPTASLWYLAVSRIVQPNPLPNFGATVVPPSDNTGEIAPTEAPIDSEANPDTETDNAETIGTPLNTPTPTSSEPVPGVPTSTPEAEATAAPIEEPTTAVNPTITATATAIGSTPTATATADPRVSPSPTPTASPTPVATSAATATPDASDGNLPTATPPPSLPTATPGGSGYPYPPPDS